MLRRRDTSIRSMCRMKRLTRIQGRRVHSLPKHRHQTCSHRNDNQHRWRHPPPRARVRRAPRPPEPQHPICSAPNLRLRPRRLAHQICSAPRRRQAPQPARTSPRLVLPKRTGRCPTCSDPPERNSRAAHRPNRFRPLRRRPPLLPPSQRPGPNRTSSPARRVSWSHSSRRPRNRRVCRRSEASRPRLLSWRRTCSSVSSPSPPRRRDPRRPPFPRSVLP
mmetsp:Transcript_31923/g.98833  ORF Transcript_31923/g.98833 Transcript_31923/m.98833 type:complete len:220 (+) Transcript_31923:1668-2327(+)